jgi:aspartate racemase
MKLGILGGMGPAASAEFATRLIQQTPATCDQEHIPFVLWNEPRVPDRSTAMRAGNDDPLQWLEDCIRGLKFAGCSCVVIPCNSAHFWYDKLVKLGVPIIHIVDSIADELRRLKINNATIGVIGTQGTIECGIYQHRLEQQGWTCIVPDRAEMDFFVQPAIDFIKAGKITESQLLLMKVIHSLIDRGARAVVLGCTELPLAIRITQEDNTPIVNSIDSLVQAVLTCWPMDCR